MMRILLTLIFAAFLFNGMAQTIDALDGTNVDLSATYGCDMDLYDDGGRNGKYDGGTDHTVTICAPAGQVVQFTIDDFSTYSADQLTFYDGSSTSDPVILNIAGDATQVGTVMESTGECVTIRFNAESWWQQNLSNGAKRHGFELSLICYAPPSCTDGIRNGSETGIDCGGCDCGPCPQTSSTTEVTASADVTELGCGGGDVNLSALGSADYPLIDNNFDLGVVGDGWDFVGSGMFTNPCGNGPNNTTHIWFGGSSPHPRELTTIPLDFRCGGEICFGLKMEVQTSQDGTDCEGPDLNNEGVTLEYSNDCGETFTPIVYFHPDGSLLGSNPYTSGTATENGETTVFTNWERYCYQIPAGGHTQNTVVQWSQLATSGADYDHWGIDEVSITAGVCDPYYYDWLEVPGSPNTADVTVNVQNTGWYHVIYTDGVSDTTYDSVFVQVNQPLPAELVLEEPGGCQGNGSSATAWLDAWGPNNEGGNTGIGPFDICLYGPDCDGDGDTIFGCANQGNGSPAQGKEFNDLCPGVYTYSTTDKNGCVIWSTFTVNLLPTCCDVTTVDVMSPCNSASGGCGGDITAVPSGEAPFSYQWYSGSGTTNPIVGEDGINITGLCEGTYTVELTDNIGCVTTTEVTITEPVELTVNVVPTQVSCFGAADGSVTATASGGVGPYEYSFNNGAWQTSGTQGGFSGGTVSVQVRDANLCIISTSIFVNEPAQIVPAIDAIVSETCDSDNGSITASATGGTGDYVYLISPDPNAQGQTSTNTFNNLPGGTYSVTVTDGSGCSEVITNVEVPIIAPPVLAVDVLNNPSCAFVPDADVTVGVTDGTATFNYTLSGTQSAGPQTTNQFTFLAVGSYTVEVEDANGCTDTVQFTIVEPPVIAATFAVDSVTCFGLDDGVITVNASGGTGVLSYSGPTGPNGTNNVFVNIAAGTYTVTVTDENLCSNTFPVSVFEPPLLEATTSFTDVTCNGANDGTYDVVPTGGTPPYTHSPNAVVPATGLAPGSYDIEVVDANGCTYDEIIVITEPVVVSGTFANNTDATCSLANGSIDVSGTGGDGTYTYELFDATSTSIATGTGATHTFGSLAAGNYTVVITDGNGCTSVPPLLFTINDNPPPVLTEGVVTAVSCNGGADGALTVNTTDGTAPISYTISPDPNTVGAQTSGSFTGLPAGDYTVTATDFYGCTGDVTITVPEPTLGSVNVTSADALCNGDASGSISFTDNGGGTAPYCISVTGSTGACQQVASVTGLSAGSYDVYIEDANGCVYYDQPVVISEPQPGYFSAVVTPETCAASNGVIDITPTGGTAAYTVTFDGTPSGAQTSFTGLSVGGYPISITDANNCVYDTIVAVSAENAPTIDATNITNVDCFGDATGSVEVVASGGTGTLTHTIAPGATTGTTNTFTHTGLAQGAYTVTVTDDNACAVTAIVNITENPQIVVTPSQDSVSCNGGADGIVYVNATGGSPGYTITVGGTGGTSPFTGLTAGTYPIVVTDALGCIANSTMDVLEPTPLAITSVVTSPNSCFGACDGQGVFTVTGGTTPYQYSSTGVTGALSNNATITGLCAGNYDFAVVDDKGCTALDPAGTVAITEPVQVTASLTPTNETCTDANGTITITAAGGDNTFTYGISPASGTLAGNVYSGLSAGSYTITITDGNGCTTVTDPSTTISDEIAPTLSGVPTDVSCNAGADGVVTLSVTDGTPGFTYDRVPTAGGLGGNTETGLAAGSYDYIVTDNNGCTSTTTVVVAEPTAPVVSVAVTDNTCYQSADSEIDVSASGGTPTYEYQINAGAWQTSNVFAGESGGSYDVVVRDANLCIIHTETVTIAEPTELTVTPTITNSTCGRADGVVDLAISGGTTAYGIVFDGGASSATTNYPGLNNGNYPIVVTDANGCIVNLTATVGNDVSPVITSVTPSVVTCFGGSDGTVVVNATGGVGTLTHTNASTASTGTGAAFTHTGLSAGSHDVTVTDANGCTAVQTVTITENSDIVITASETPTLCNGSSDGIITVGVTGGTAAYTIEVNNAAGTSPFTGYAAGVHTIDVTDALGCTQTSTVTVTEPTPLVIDATNPSAALCYNECSGQVDITASGGTTPYTYGSGGTTGSFGGTNIITGLCPGDYDFAVQDANGCTVSVGAGNLVTIVNPTELTYTLTPTDETCTNTNGTITVNAAGGDGNYTYGISPSTGTLTTNVYSGLTADSYTVSVTDGNGCTVTPALTVAIANQASPTLSGVETPAVCNGDANGVVTLATLGGTSGFTFENTTSSTVLTGNTESGLSAGTYNYEVTDANGCTATTSVTVTEPAVVSSTSNVIVNNTCFESCDGSITITPAGGSGGHEVRLNGGAWQTGTSYTNLCDGAYTVEVRDMNGCMSTVYNENITEPGQILFNPTILANSNCSQADGEIQIAASGGSGGTFDILVQRSPDTTALGVNTQKFTQIISGTHNFLITDNGNGCTASGSFSMLDAAGPSMVVNQTDIVCNGASTGSIQVVGSDGSGAATAVTTITLDAANTQSASSHTYGTLPAGTYIVRASDVANCFTEQTITLTEPDAYVITSNMDSVLCNGDATGQFEIFASGNNGGYSYAITSQPAGAAPAGSNPFTGLIAGSYDVVVTDAQGCASNTQTVNVLEPTVLALTGNVTSQVTCFNACDAQIDVSASGGTPPYLYSNGSTTQSSGTFAAQCANTYTMVATDANGCSVNRTGGDLVVTEPAQLAYTTSSTNETCSDDNGTITINATGGTTAYTYALTPAGGVLAGNAFTGLDAGSYQVVVSDANNCAPLTVTTVTISDEVAPVLSIASVDSVSCNGFVDGSVELAVTNGTVPFQYDDNAGLTSPQASNVFSPLGAGSYTFYIEDANGCTANVSTTVFAPNSGSANMTPTDNSCFDANDGSITVAPSGGTTPYSYSIDAGPLQAGNSFTGLSDGSYDVDVFDANGCIISQQTIVINEPTLILANASFTDENCEQDNGTITVTPSQGSGAGYTTSITGVGNLAAVNNYTGLTAGTYTVDIEDGTGCSIQEIVVISETAYPTIDNIDITNLTCNGDNTSAIEVDASGGTGNITLTINGGNDQVSASPLNHTYLSQPAGNHTIQIEDAVGCIVTQPVTLTQPDAYTVTVNVTDVDCNGASTGEVEVLVSGNTAPYTYSINGDPFVGTNTFVGQPQGGFTIDILDVNNCPAIQQAGTINQPTALSITSVTPTVNSCFAACDGTIDIVATGGTLPYVYSNGFNGQAGSTFTNLCAGDYNVSVTDANGCIVLDPGGIRNIGEPAQLDYTIAITNETCSSDNGQIAITATGGNGIYSYTLNPAVGNLNGSTFEDLDAGSYDVLVTDQNNCASLSSLTAVLTDEISPVVSVGAQTAVTCNGLADAQVTLSVVSATGSIRYSDDAFALNDQTSNVYTGLAAGNYTYTVVDGNGCTDAIPVTITEPTQGIAGVTSTNETCDYNDDAIFTFNASGGTPPYQYSLDNGGSWSATSFPASTNTDSPGQQAGTYDVQVRDDNGCVIYNTQLSVTEPNTLTANVVANNATCDVDNGDVTITASGGTGVLDVDLTGVGNSNSPAFFNGLTNGTYGYVVTDDNGCVFNGTTSIAMESSPIITSITGSNLLCFGDSDGTIDVTTIGGTGNITHSITSPAIIAGGIAQDFQHTALSAGTYTVTIEDQNNCIVNGTGTVNQPTDLIIAASGTDLLCYQNGLGEVAVSAVGGTPGYVYDLGGTATVNQPGNGLFTGLDQGNYTITVTDANNCVKTIAGGITLTEPAELVLSNVSSTNVVCNGNCDGTLSADISGGVMPYTFDLGGNIQSTEDYTGLCPGTYTYSVTDANGCITNNPGGNVVITEPALFNGNVAATDELCDAVNGSVIASPSGGTVPYSIAINPPSLPVTSWGTNMSNTGLEAGTFQVFMEDGNGCTFDTTVYVQDLYSPRISEVTPTDPTCNAFADGTIVTNTSQGAATYSWSIAPAVDGPLTGTGVTFNNVVAGDYTITVTDTNSCTVDVDVSVSEPAALILTNSVIDNRCYDEDFGAITLGSSGGTPTYMYEITNVVATTSTPVAAPTGQQSSNIFNGLSAGIYTIQLEDAQGCLIADDIEIVEPAILDASAVTTDVLCFGDNTGIINITATGGTLPYLYNVDGVVSGSNVYNQEFAGNKVITVSDSNNCQIILNETVGTPALLEIDVTTVDETCNAANGEVNITVTGGITNYTYDIQGPTVGSSDLNANMDDGAYSVVVTDANGCTADSNVFIYAISVPVLNYTDVTDPLCFGDANAEVEAHAFGGVGPFVFTLSLPNTQANVNDSLFTGVSAGNGTVTITDANNCTDQIAVTITDPAVLGTSAAPSVSDVLCNAGSTGNLELFADGGTAPYRYSFDNGASFGTSSTNAFIPAGSYDWIIEDANGCQITGNSVVNEPTPFVSAPVVTDALCFGECNGEIAANLSGGTLPYEYNWTGVLNGQTSDIATGACAGTYTLYALDANGCNITEDFVVSEPVFVQITSVISDSTSCYGTDDGIITVTAPAASSFTITNATGVSVNQNSPVFDGSVIGNLPAGNYVVDVFNANGCAATTSVAIYEPDSIIMSVLRPDEICTYNDFIMSAYTTGGNGGYTYTWDSTAVGGTTVRMSETSNLLLIQNPTIEFALEVTVTDSKGCTAAQSEVVPFALIPPVYLSSINDTVICKEDSITEVFQAYDGLREFVYGHSAVLGSNDSTLIVADSGWVVYGVLDRCDQEVLDSFYVGYHADPVVTLASGAGVGCAPAIATFSIDDTSGFGCYLNMGDGNDYYSCDPIEHIYQYPGIYDIYYSYNTSNGCFYDTTFASGFVVYDIPNVQYFAEPYEASILNPEIEFINISTSGEEFIWDIETIGQFNSDNGPTITFPEEVAAYDVCITGSIGYGDTTCTATYCDEVRIYDETRILAPNVIHVGGDVVANGTFLPYLYGYNPFDYTLYIFNRWGELVFESHDMSIGWDGTYNGVNVQDGVYVWKIVALNNRTDERETHYGHVTVLR